jgi:predicted molibdopterin-dependent oxidoreductase YjgC
VQRIRAAVPKAGESLAAWQALAQLGAKLGVPLAYASAGEVFADASQHHGFMKGVVWEPPVPPVLLRFGESRG